jgi:hypothetical protein
MAATERQPLDVQLHMDVQLHNIKRHNKGSEHDERIGQG